MNVVTLFQLAMKGLGHNIKVDGIAGKETREVAETAKEGKAILELIPSAKAAILANAAPTGYISENDVKPFIAEAVKLTGESEVYFRKLLDLEPSKKIIGGVMYYKVDSGRGGTYRGLTQCSATAWGEGATLAKQKNVKIDSYDEAAYDPRQSIIVAGFYAQKNRLYVENGRGYDGYLTPSQLYTLHNQGWTAFDWISGKVSRLRFPKQSESAKKTFLVAKLEGLRETS